MTTITKPKRKGSPPEDTIRDGAIKASIWKNEPIEEGKRPYYEVKISRTFSRDDGQTYEDAYTYTGADVLKVAHIAQRAYAKILAYRGRDAVEAKLEREVA